MYLRGVWWSWEERDERWLWDEGLYKTWRKKFNLCSVLLVKRTRMIYSSAVYIKEREWITSLPNKKGPISESG